MVVLQPEDRDRGVRDALAAARNPEQRSVQGAAAGQARNDRVARGDQLVDLVVEIGKGRADGVDVAQELGDAVGVRSE